MKNFTCFIIGILILAEANAADIVASTNGKWNQASTWNLNRVPASGDRVIIPFGKTVSVNTLQNYNSATLIIEISGKLDFLSNGRLFLGDASTVLVRSTGIIDGNNAAQSLQIGGVTKFTGNELITGTVIANSSTGSSPNGFEPYGTLPVKFISFNVIHNNNDYVVQWSTSEELNSAYYEVERSEDGLGWIAVARIRAAGNSTSVSSYSYNDRNITLKKVLYRVKQVDQDGKLAYSAVKTFTNNHVGALYISNTAGQVAIRFNSAVKGPVMIQVVSINGRVASSQVVKDPSGNLLLSTRALKGHYIVTVQGQELSAVKQVIF